MKSHLNLMPLSALKRQLVGRRILQWTIVTACVLPALVVYGTLKWRGHRHSESQLETIEREYQPVEQLRIATVSFDKKIEAFRQQERLTLELSQKRSIVTLLGYLGQAAEHSQGRINIESFELKPLPRTGDEEAAGRRTRYQASIGGYSIDNLAIARFVAELRDSNLFGQVELISTGSVVVNDLPAKIYSMKIEF